MSHYCNKHSQSPIRYKSGNNSQLRQPPTSSSQKGDPAKLNIKIEYPSPFNETSQRRTPNNFRGQQTESTHADLSPLIQQKIAQMQMPTTPFQFQNFVSNDGVALRPHEIDQMKLRQEIAAREHELKLLAQMDYLLDLIKSLDQDHNLNIDTQKIEEIERLKSDYQSINDEIQNLSFSQNMQASVDRPKRASRQNNDLGSNQNPLGYSSVGGNQAQQPILQEINQEGFPTDQIRSAPLYQSANLQDQQQQYQQQPQGEPLQNSIRSNQQQPNNMNSSQRSNALQQSIRSNLSNRQQPGVPVNEDPNQQEVIHTASLLASTQEQLFQNQNNPTTGEQDLQSQPYPNQSQRQSLQNSINNSKKPDFVKELVGSGVPTYSQHVANQLYSSQQSQHPVQGYDQLYNSNQSNLSQRPQSQKVPSQHSIQQQQQQPENYNTSPLNQGSLQQQLTGSYSLKGSQRQPNSQQQLYSSANQNQLYQSNPQLYSSNNQQPQPVSPAQQRLEQSIQTSLQLITSIAKAPAQNQGGEKNQLEQQIYLYEKQIKELLEENECLKKNIADQQIFRKPLISAENKELYSSIASKASHASFAQPPTAANAERDQENQIIQNLQDALHEKDADLQILIQNITSEKDQNKYLIEENDILKNRLQNLEREVQDMQEQRQRQPTFEMQNKQGLEGYSSVEGSNYGSVGQADEPKEQLRRESELQQELDSKQEYFSKRLSELESEQKERSVHYQEEIARLNRLIQSVKDELGYQQALHVDYIGRYNQDKLNKTIQKYQELVENEQIKNMLSSDMQDTLGHTVSEQEKIIEGLKEQLSKIKSEYDHREQQLIEYNELKNAELGAKNIQLQENVQELQAKNQDQADQIAYLDQELQQIQQRYIEIEMKKENLILENNELKARIDQLEEARNQENSMKEDTIKHITEMHDIIEQKNQEIDALQQQKDALQAEYEDLAKSLTDMESNLMVVQESFKYSRSQHEALKRETEEFKELLIQNSEVDQETEEIHKTIKELKQELNIEEVQEEVEEDIDPRKSSKHPHDLQNELHHSHASKQSHKHSSMHSSAKFMKDSQTNRNQPITNQQQAQFEPEDALKQSQQLYDQYPEHGEYNEDGELVEGDGCDMCMLEELVRQNEQLKQQLLLKEKEIIELKTNPHYYARTQAQINSLGKTPFSGGKGQMYLDTNDQVFNNRVFESPMARQAPVQNAFTSPQAVRPQFDQQQQQQQIRGSLSNSKQPDVQQQQQLSSSQKQQLLQQQLQQQQQHQSGGSQSNYQSYSVLQQEIEHLQKIFDQKCKEVDSWKKTYTQFYEQ